MMHRPIAALAVLTTTTSSMAPRRTAKPPPVLPPYARGFNFAPPLSLEKWDTMQSKRVRVQILYTVGDEKDQTNHERTFLRTKRVIQDRYPDCFIEGVVLTNQDDAFKILVDAGANANACSKTSGSVVFKLANPEMDDNMMSMAAWMGMGDDAARSKGFMILCVVMALRYVMLESPRRDDVDMKTPVSICRSGHRDWGETEQKSEPILDIALRHPFPEIRRIFARAAAEKEEQQPGSGVSV